MKSLQISNHEFFALAKEMLQQGKSVDIRVKGNSMRPFLFDGETVTVAPILPDSVLSEGLIILTDTSFHKVMMHRICRIEGDIITMRGDGNLIQRESVHRSQIFGIVETFTRKGRTISPYSPIRRVSAQLWNFYPIRRIGLFLVRMFCH